MRSSYPSNPAITLPSNGAACSLHSAAACVASTSASAASTHRTPCSRVSSLACPRCSCNRGAVRCSMGRAGGLLWPMHRRSSRCMHSSRPSAARSARMAAAKISGCAALVWEVLAPLVLVLVRVLVWAGAEGVGCLAARSESSRTRRGKSTNSAQETTASAGMASHASPSCLRWCWG